MGVEAIGNFNQAAPSESLKMYLSANIDDAERSTSEAVSTTDLEINPTPVTDLVVDNSYSKMSETTSTPKMEHHGQLIDANSDNLLALVEKCTGLRNMGLKEDDLKRLVQLMIKAPERPKDEKEKHVVTKQKTLIKKNPEKKIQIEDTVTAKETKTDKKIDIIRKDMSETTKLAIFSTKNENVQITKKTELKLSDQVAKTPKFKDKMTSEKPFKEIELQKKVSHAGSNRSDESFQQNDYRSAAIRDELANRTLAANIMKDNNLLANKNAENKISSPPSYIKPMPTKDAELIMIKDETNYSSINTDVSVDSEPRDEFPELLPDYSATNDSAEDYLTEPFNTRSELEDSELADIEEPLLLEAADILTNLTLDAAAIEYALESAIDSAQIETIYPTTAVIEDIELGNVQTLTNENEAADIVTNLTLDAAAIEYELESAIDSAQIETIYPTTAVIEDIELGKKVSVEEAQIVDLSLKDAEINDSIINSDYDISELLTFHLEASLEDDSNSSLLDQLSRQPQPIILGQPGAINNDSLVDETSLDLSKIATQEARFLTKSKVLASISMYSAKQLLGIFAVLSATSI